jgi:hypothetical protein
LEFQWYPGFAKVQAQKSIASLHEEANSKGWGPVLEISSKSENPIGVALSAFNLVLQQSNRPSMSVEAAFQGSKVFERGGPFRDLYQASSREAKKDERLRLSGNLIKFDFFGEEWPTWPLTAFYDWLYMTALSQNPELSEQLSGYRAFSDIAFNPEKSLNCQARAAALFVALQHASLVDEAVSSKASFLRLLGAATSRKSNQLDLPLAEE